MRTRRATPVAAASGGRVAAILRHKKKVMAPRRRYRVQPPRAAEAGPAKRRRLAWDADDRSGGVAAVDSFDALPDDLILCILRRLSSTASTPSDLLSVQMTCKRLRALALHPLVMCRASPKSLAVPPNKWSEAPHLFLRRCAEAGNLDASYMLGMIRFYCLGNRPGGMSLLARAAMRQHAPSLYSLAVIQFNGSGSFLKSSKNLRAGVLLCARAASLGHVDALRELGHCLQDGYGVRRDFAKGRRFLVQANAREIAAALRGIPNGFARLLEARKQHQNQNQLQGQQQQQQYPQQQPEGLLPPLLPLLSDFGWNLLPALQVHPANQFLTGWFALSGGAVGGLAGSEDLRMCSHLSCGRPETRRHEFRRCSICGKANYCSRACQALDWRLRHKGECVPIQQWVPVEVQVQVEFHPQPPQQVQIPADSGPANDDGAYAAAG